MAEVHERLAGLSQFHETMLHNVMSVEEKVVSAISHYGKIVVITDRGAVFTVEIDFDFALDGNMVTHRAVRV